MCFRPCAILLKRAEGSSAHVLHLARVNNLHYEGDPIPMCGISDINLGLKHTHQSDHVSRQYMNGNTLSTRQRFEEACGDRSVAAQHAAHDEGCLGCGRCGELVRDRAQTASKPT